MLQGSRSEAARMSPAAVGRDARRIPRATRYPTLSAPIGLAPVQREVVRAAWAKRCGHGHELSALEEEIRVIHQPRRKR